MFLTPSDLTIHKTHVCSSLLPSAKPSVSQERQLFPLLLVCVFPFSLSSRWDGLLTLASSDGE